MLVAWRHVLVFCGRFADDCVVGDDGGIVAEGYNFHVVGREFEQARVAQIIRSFGAFDELAIDSYEREVRGQGSLEKCSVVSLLGFDEILFIGECGLFEGAGRFDCWSSARE